MDSNVPNVPEAIESAIGLVAEVMSRQLGDRLIALILYGSAARSLYQPGRSDVNLLVVVRVADLPALETVRAALSAAGTDLTLAPYLVAETELPRVAHAFPTRILEMKRGYIVLAGKDALAGVVISRDVLAVRCGQELLNLLLRFRHLLLAGNAPDSLERGLRAALGPFIKVLRTLIYLRTGQHLDDRQQIVQTGAAQFGFAEDSLLQLLAWRSGRLVLGKDDWAEAASGFFAGLSKIAGALDG